MELRNGNGGNGNRVLTIALSLAVPPVIGIVIAWVSSSNNRMGSNSERIAVIEVQLKDTRDELRFINIKLDKLLDPQRRP